MAIAFVDSRAHESGSASFLTIDVPGHTDGDLLVAVISRDFQAPVTTPIGWTLDLFVDAASNNDDVWVFRRVASGEPVSYTFTGSGNTTWRGAIHSYSGAADGPPLDADGFAASSGTTNATPALDVGAATGALLVGGCVVRQGAINVVPPTGFIERQQRNATARSIATADLVLTTETGSQGPFSWSWSPATSLANASAMAAYAPAAVGPADISGAAPAAVVVAPSGTVDTSGTATLSATAAVAGLDVPGGMVDATGSANAGGVPPSVRADAAAGTATASGVVDAVGAAPGAQLAAAAGTVTGTGAVDVAGPVPAVGAVAAAGTLQAEGTSLAGLVAMMQLPVPAGDLVAVGAAPVVGLAPAVRPVAPPGVVEPSGDVAVAGDPPVARLVAPVGGLFAAGTAEHPKIVVHRGQRPVTYVDRYTVEFREPQ